MLDSEVVDLRVCLQSADKELEELRMERKAEGRVHESRLMEHMQRVSTQHNSSAEMSEWPGNKATGNARWWYEAIHKHIYHPAHKHIFHPAHK